MPWNVHEPFPEQYDWDGIADLEAYLQLAQDMELYVLLRPGPYICAEWDFGGFPWWLASSKVWMCTWEMSFSGERVLRRLLQRGIKAALLCLFNDTGSEISLRSAA